MADEETVQDDLYADHILDHYESPYHKGRLEHPTCTHRLRNPLCGDVVQLDVKVDERGRITKAYFDGQGCAISQAGASILCEAIEGKSLDEARELQAQDMLDLLKVRLTAPRQQCGLLGFKALKTIVYSIDDQQTSNETTDPAPGNSLPRSGDQ